MNTHPLPRRIHATGTHNLRDLGGYATAAGRPVPPGRFWRGDSLHALAPGEAARLHFEGLAMVIDLRSPAEVRDAPSPLARQSGVDWVNLPLFDALSPGDLAQVAVPEGHPLLAVYITAIETRGTAIRSILHRMAQAREGAVLFNCTAGKDRTGLIAALLLGLAGVSHSQIIADYSATAAFIPDLVADFLRRARASGADVDSYATLLESPASAMAGLLAHIDGNYGSVMGYLDHIEVDTATLSRLQIRLGLND